MEEYTQNDYVRILFTLEHIMPTPGILNICQWHSQYGANKATAPPDSQGPVM